MGEPLIGSEAVAAGLLVKSALRTRYTRVFRNVYVERGAELSAVELARAGWLWSRRRGVIAGLTASAVHGSKWIDRSADVELIHTNRNPVKGIKVRGDFLAEDEFETVEGVPVTTPARTALDLACWYPLGAAVAAVDALARATGVKLADSALIADRYPGRRRIAQARRVLDLTDAGAQSPKESWLRLVLIEAGLPRPQTQIPVYDEFGDVIAYLDMGWKDLKVAVEYDGEQHRRDRYQYWRDVRRLELLERRGWIVIRVVVGDQPADIIRRVRAALARRASHQRDSERRASR